MEYTRLRYRDPQHHCNKKAAYLYFQVLENKVGQIINNDSNINNERGPSHIFG